MFLRRVRHARGLRLLLLLAALLVCASFASTASAAPVFRDTVLSPAAARSLQATSEWGGPTLATDGETVKIYFSDSYPVDPARALQWADFMTSLVHGTELATVTIHLAPLTEVQRMCGAGALACYTPTTSTIVAPGDDPEPGTSAKGVLTHEYGHHVAASRLNPPFASVDYGTKRWASYENVCAEASAGDLYPGAEDRFHYMLNPGEAFAETYRVLNEQKLGLPLEPWDIVTTTLYPDATALSLLEQDVLTPWTADTTQRLTAKLTAKVRTRTFKVSVPYDGTLIVQPRQAGHANVTVSLLAKGATVKAKSFKRASGASLSTMVCGQRQYSVRVQLAGTVAKTTRTTVTVTVSTP
jgi:hypothetical protein